MTRIKRGLESAELIVDMRASGATSAANTATAPVERDAPSDRVAFDAEIADARDFNLAFESPHDTVAGLPDLNEPGEVLRGTPVFGLTGDWDASRPGDNNVRTQIDTGRLIDVGTDGYITFGFFDHQHATGINNRPAYGEGKGYTPFSEAQKAATRIAVSNWDEYIAPEFREVSMGPGASGWGQNVADIWLANTFTGPAQAWAYSPGYDNSGTRIASDVWTMDPRFNGSNAQFEPGFYALQTLNHELGHSLGFSHPGSYDFGDDNDGDGVPDPITYGGDAFYAQDNHQYSIMSYFDSFEAGNNQVDFNYMRFVYASTPMVHDIWIMQQKYGVETTTRTGDTTYGFNATSDVTNAAMRFEVGEMATIFTIWDAGGNDTIDLSGYYSDSVIDLREGAYISAGGWGSYNDALPDDPSTLTKEAYLAIANGYNAAQFAAGHTDFTARTAAYDLYFGGRAGVNESISWSEIMGFDYLMENNIGIAYGAIVENAKGGEGDDRINGNWATNHFWGNGGADTFIIADYDGTTLAGAVRVDNSIDVIEDFDRSEGDRIDLSELGVSFADLSFNDSTDTVTVDGGLKFVILGASDIQAADFVF